MGAPAGRLREPVLPAGCKPVGDVKNVPVGSTPNPVFALSRLAEPGLSFAIPRSSQNLGTVLMCVAQASNTH